jgi:hypothetical protein
MKKAFIVAVLAAASMSPATLLAQGADEVDPAVGKQVYALKKVMEEQFVGTIVQADANALRLRIGEYCVGLPRQNFTQKDGKIQSPWTREALEATIQGGNPEDFTCVEVTDQTDPVVGNQVFAMAEVQKKDVFGTVVAVDPGALRVRIGEYCVGLPRQNFTEKDGQFESPWTREALEATIQAGNTEDFACSA